MSLYTLPSNQKLQRQELSAGLRLEESSDIGLLARLADLPANEIVRRLANDNLAFVAYLKDEPAGFGWMARGKARIGELNHDLVLPLGNRYLWNFRTLEPFRGLGIYPALLQHIIRRERYRSTRFWIIHAPENQSSLRGIRKAGFQFVGNLFTDQGRTRIEAASPAIEIRSLLEEMDIEISTGPSASCWNCSSPYIKKRKPECCCQLEFRRCTPGGRQVVFA